MGPVIPLLLGAGGLLANSLSSGGRQKSDDRQSPLTPAEIGYSLRGKPQLDAEQLRSVEVIDYVVKRVKLPRSLQERRTALKLALLVNAWEESRLRPNAVAQTDREESVGLFQINRRGALGKSFTRAQLVDPVFNSRVIMGEVIRQAEVLSAAETVGDMIELVCVHVERPADRFRVGRQRRAWGRYWLGRQVVDGPAESALKR